MAETTEAPEWTVRKLLVRGDAVEANPQTAPRVALLGEATIDDSALARARYLVVHPYAALYAGFGDFHLWRLRVASAAFVGGFARAFRLTGEAIRPDPSAVAAIVEASAGIMAHCNADHADTMALLAEAELAVGETTRHVPWSRPVASANEVRQQLILLARSARATGAS
jgi:putative heme iron utilization protein